MGTLSVPDHQLMYIDLAMQPRRNVKPDNSGVRDPGPVGYFHATIIHTRVSRGIYSASSSLLGYIYSLPVKASPRSLTNLLD